MVPPRRWRESTAACGKEKCCSGRRRPGGLALVVEEDLHQVEALAGRGDAGVLAVAGGEGAGDGALGEAAAGDVGEGAHQDADHVVEEGVALDVDADEAWVARVEG